MKRRGQSTLEYAVVIAVVLAALIAIQIYVKRGIQGKLRSSTDQIGEQYSAGKMTSTFTTEQTGELKQRESFGVVDKGISKSEIITAAPVTRSATGPEAEATTTALNAETLYK